MMLFGRLCTNYYNYYNRLCKRYIFNQLFNNNTNDLYKKNKKRANYEIEKIVNYDVEDVYNIVCDVNSYKEFLPFCTNSNIIKYISKNQFEADLEIGFHIYTETYRSLVTLTPYKSINIKAIDSSLFSYLSSNWDFKSDKNGTLISFHVDFEVTSLIHSVALGRFFSHVCDAQLEAFEQRCKLLLSNKTNHFVSSTNKDNDNVKPNKSKMFMNNKNNVNIITNDMNNYMITSKHVDSLRDIIIQVTDNKLIINEDHWLKICKQLLKLHTFKRFRHRFLFRVVEDDHNIGRQIFNLYFFGNDHQNKLDKRINIDSFIHHFLHIVNHDPTVKWAHCWLLTRYNNNDQTCNKLDLCNKALEYYQLQLDIHRAILPVMIHQYTKNNNDTIESGMKAIGIMGVVDDVLNEMSLQVTNLIKESVANVENKTINMAQWKEIGEDNKAILNNMTIPTIASAIEYASLTTDNNY